MPSDSNREAATVAKASQFTAKGGHLPLLEEADEFVRVIQPFLVGD